jgi:hypothetical protein
MDWPRSGVNSLPAIIEPRRKAEAIERTSAKQHALADPRKSE